MQKEAANFASVWKCLYITYIFMWNNYICVYLVGARGVALGSQKYEHAHNKSNN